MAAASLIPIFGDLLNLGYNIWSMDQQLNMTRETNALKHSEWKDEMGLKKIGLAQDRMRIGIEGQNAKTAARSVNNQAVSGFSEFINGRIKESPALRLSMIRNYSRVGSGVA